MKVKCSWCGSWINDYDEACPNCGGKNEQFKRTGTGAPRTIEELKAWAEAHHLPLRQMRTYIGKNYTGPKAFGIYRDETTGNYIVYKNKADGTRSVRYEGPDEAYAVNELYQKMKERVAEQKSHQRTGRGSGVRLGGGSSGRAGGSGRLGGPVYLNTGNPVGYENEPRRQKPKSVAGRAVKSMLLIILASQVLVAAVFFLKPATGRSPHSGYYHYSDSMYYWQDATDAWYIYNYDAARWDTCYDDLDYLYDHYDDYYIPSYSYADYDVTDFTTSGYYEVPSYSDDSGWNSDWDDDYDWDSGSDWDSGWDDWDSDW